MKIRKANITAQIGMIGDVYLHENKKEFHTLVAVPQLEWSTIISYEEEKASLSERLEASLLRLTEEEPALELTKKIIHWVTEM
ncbi:MAG: YueH family protein [Bacillota bacterium]